MKTKFSKTILSVFLASTFIFAGGVVPANAVVTTNHNEFINTDSLAKAEKDNKIYENHYNIDCKNLNFSIDENGELQIAADEKLISTNAKQEKGEINKILSNKKFTKDLKKMIESGKTPVQIGVAEAYFLHVTDKDGNLIEERPMTYAEVLQYGEDKSAIISSDKGEIKKKDKLSLYVSLSGTSGDYWVQSNAYWSGSVCSDGDDFISVLWNKDYLFDGEDKFSGSYYVYNSIRGSLCALEESAGASWSFADSHMEMVPYAGTEGVYAGVQLSKEVLAYKTYTFKGVYTRTYKELDYGASIEFSSAGATGSLTITPTSNQWNLVAHLTGRY